MEPKHIKVNKNGEIAIEQFADVVDIELVQYYRFSDNNGKLTLEFFDAKKNQIKLKKSVDTLAQADIGLDVTNNPRKGATKEKI